jgi:multidrug efflux pump subunit AcrB
MNESPLGISGRIARLFVRSEITPLLALTGLLLGVFAVLVTPREEEPQINVTFANVFVPFPGATAVEVEHLVSTPGGQVLSEISGVKHVYSVSRPGLALLTVEFEVGENRTDAIVRLYDKVFSNQDWLPPTLGVGQPIVRARGIDDVPIIAITLWTEDPQRGAYELLQVAHALEAEIKRVPNTRDIRTIGGPERVIHVLLDPAKLAGYGIALDDLRRAIFAANRSVDSSAVVVENEEVLVKAGTLLASAEEVSELVVGLHGGNPVYLSDVARVREGPDFPQSYVSFGTGPAAQMKGITARGRFPAVTLTVAKKPGSNAVTVADEIIKRVEQLRGIFIPDGIEVTVSRNYGETADAKARKLIQKLIFATTSVIVLVWLAMGWREAFIVGVAVVITLATTLFASWAYGFTLNRVSLFALIFSIGILVDDAIVVVENIHRHRKIGGKKLLEAIPSAVDEVGGPTILATFTVIAALLPMAFVTGLMGPYMSPIPINASMGMLISLVVAFVVTPWLTYRMTQRAMDHGAPEGEPAENWLYKLFALLVGPFLRGKGAHLKRVGLAFGVLLLIVLSLSLAVFQIVVLKMLPFDNKSEFQVIVDMPEGTSLEQTARVLDDIAHVLTTVPEVTDYQAYAGTASPIGFNGLVRQYYLRQQPFMGDIQVNLVDPGVRSRKSHRIAQSVRKLLRERLEHKDANIKIVEVPPGPPVLAPLVAEIYGLDYDGQIRVARQVRTVFEQTKDIVDVDDSVTAPGRRIVVRVDRQRAALLGVSQASVTAAVATLLGGEDVSFLHGANVKYAVPIRVEFPESEKPDPDAVLMFKVRGTDGRLVPLSEIVELREDQREHAIYQKDLLPVVYVVGDMAGRLDSPLYGMGQVVSRLHDTVTELGTPLPQYFIAQPANPYSYALKWNGEWQITYETFRDMGIAYAVGMVLIYLLVVGQFRSYLAPLIIMAPIPLTVIGVLPGHALLGAQFTATSMIGMIALAGIIVRNSILLVDFVNQEVRKGMDLDEAVIRSGAVRARPIVLTALAAMLGAFFILDDPIFNGLAVSLIFGIFISTLLTLAVIPVLYYAFMRGRLGSVTSR